MTKGKNLVGAHKKIAKQIQTYSHHILTGTFISIDPGSTSPGWALWMGGNLVDSGAVKLKGKNISERLANLQDFLEGFPNPDVMATEKIGMTRGGPKGKAQSHRYLHWSQGSIVGSLRTERVLEIPTGMWKKWADKYYTKGDEADAIYIGKCVIAIAKET